MKASLRVAILFLLAVIAVNDLAAQPIRGKSRPKLRVVIDASHDGGAWWFPQGPPPFDFKKPHQGVALADYLKKRRWEVVEIPRERKITNQLKRASIVVRMNVWGTYDESELAAYREFVTNGGRLLLVRGYVRPGEAESDTVAKQFGIRFEGIIEESVMRSADAGNFTRDFNDATYKIGSIVVDYPKSTQPLAYVNNDRLVMGTFRYGRGKIIFLSSVFPLLHVSQPFTGRLFDDLARRDQRKASSPIPGATASGSVPNALSDLKTTGSRTTFWAKRDKDSS